MVRERDDVDIKDILSDLSRDETVLEEVRKIAIRGLTAQGSRGDDQRVRVPSQEVERVNNNGDTSGRMSSKSETVTQRQEDISEKQSTAAAAAASDEELAFTVSKDSDTYRNILSTVQWCRDSFLGRASSRSDTVTQRQDTSEKQSTAVTAAAAESDEELAFTVSKDSDTYRTIFSTVQWYRDSFLVGSNFADQRSAERTNVDRENDERKQTIGESRYIGNNQSAKQNVIPKSDPSTAMGHPLLLSAGENYIRSIAAVDLLRPYATWAVSRNGPMFATATQSMAQSIPLGQSSCDWAMRENLLWVLKDEEWREFAKSITTTYVDRSYKDG